MGSIVTESILTSIKELHGVSEDDPSFDKPLIIHINSALMLVRRLGVGPAVGFFIDGPDQKWVDYIPNDRIILEAVKSFVYVKVRLIFDPPASPTVVEALKSSADEYACAIRDWAEENL
jgi:hypothetical protein